VADAEAQEPEQAATHRLRVPVAVFVVSERRRPRVIDRPASAVSCHAGADAWF